MYHQSNFVINFNFGFHIECQVCEKHLSPTVLAKIQRISTENKNEKQESENQKSENPKKLKIDPLNRGSRSSGSGGSGSSGRTLTGQNVGKKLRKQTRRLHQSDSREEEYFQNSNKIRSEGDNAIQSYNNFENENEDENEDVNGIGGINSNLSRKDSRKLRLKWSYIPDKKLGVNLDFIPEILYESIEWRLKEYHTAYKLLPLHLQKELDIINNRLKKYGYSLDEGKELYFKTEKSIFDPWTSDL